MQNATDSFQVHGLTVPFATLAHNTTTAAGQPNNAAKKRLTFNVEVGSSIIDDNDRYNKNRSRIEISPE